MQISNLTPIKGSRIWRYQNRFFKF